MEMMHHEAGVQTVVVGGRPANGPMQAPCGSRGARFYSTETLDSNIAYVAEINTTAGDFLPARTEDVYITYAGINLRDQIRKGENIPLQFVYEAANCRIFYTPQTFYNYTNLWNYAADAIWSKPELCVKDSTGHATTRAVSDTKGPAPESASADSKVSPNMTDIIRLSGVTDGFNAAVIGGLPDSSTTSRSVKLTSVKECTPSGGCPAPYVCRNERAGCDEQGKTILKYQCLPGCTSILGGSSFGQACQWGSCNLESPIRAQEQTDVSKKYNIKGQLWSGHCPPAPIQCGTPTGPQTPNQTLAPPPPQ